MHPQNADGKKFRDLVENVKRELDETAQTFVRTLEEFDAGVSAAQAGLGEVEEANTLVAQLAAELASGEALQRELEAERRALEAAEASNRELQGKIAARQREVGALAHEIAPAERHVAELTEEAQVRGRWEAAGLLLRCFFLHLQACLAGLVAKAPLAPPSQHHPQLRRR